MPTNTDAAVPSAATPAIDGVQPVSVSLWFDDTAEQAWELYSSVFPQAELHHMARFGPEGPGPEGQVITMSFSLNGQEMMAINGGPMYSPTPAVSLVVGCDTQAQIDHYWSRLTADGGEEGQCGWLTDRFGFSWQIVPSRLGEWTGHPDADAAQRATKAMLAMAKLDIPTLEAAVARR